MTTFYVKKSTDDICHYGILGMKWGVRRYQNADGTLTSEGRSRYGDNSLRSGYQIDNAAGFISKTTPIFRQKEYKIQKNIAKSTKGYNNLLTTDVKNVREQKRINDSIINDIREKRSSEAAGAFLKDLGYKDTARGRKEILSLFDTKELKNMTDINQISRITQIAIAGALGAAAIHHSTLAAMTLTDLIYDAQAKTATAGLIKKQKQLTSRNIWKDITKSFEKSLGKDSGLLNMLTNTSNTSGEGFSMKNIPSQWILNSVKGPVEGTASQWAANGIKKQIT